VSSGLAGSPMAQHQKREQSRKGQGRNHKEINDCDRPAYRSVTPRRPLLRGSSAMTCSQDLKTTLPRATIPYRLALTNFAIGHDVIEAGFPRLSVSASRHILADGEITVHSQAIHDRSGRLRVPAMHVTIQTRSRACGAKTSKSLAPLPSL
jgi:hypothetical protein